MPDVEVKLNIEAEYKQALAAIAAMGKALEAVQAKAKALTDATKNVAAVSGAGGGQNEALTATQKLNEASKQLAGHLAQVAVASTKAKDSLQAIAGIEPYREESLELINKAAAGYEKLASMAQMAANAAERFRKVGADGLTTEEMIKQTQAAEKQLETLRAQSVELERSIAAQREQLNVLRETTAEQQKQAQVRSAEDKEREKSIAIREREAKAEEEADFKMKLAGKTRLELSAIYKELAQKAKEASAAQDYEAAAKYERQMQLVNQTLRKVNTSARIANIALMQQAQAAQRIGQNLEALTTGFSGLSEALENGELNLTSMGSAFISLMRDFKAGLGPIGWVMLALQGLQAVLNNHAKIQKKIAESEKENAKILSNEKTLYEELKTAREEYDAQISLANSLTEVKNTYGDIKTTLTDSLKLIEDSTKAELVRLSLIKDEEEFARIQQKYELGRAYKRGDISEEDYRKRLVSLEQEQKTAEAKRRAAEQETKLEAQRKVAEKKEDAATTAMNQWSAAEKAYNSFNVSDKTISSYENKILKQKEIAAEEEKKARDILERAGVSDKNIDYALKNGLTREFFQSLERFQLSTGDAAILGHYIENRRVALGSANKMQQELTDILGGRTSFEYTTQKNIAKQSLDFWTQQKDATQEEAIRAWQDVNNQPTKTDISNAAKNEVNKINAEAREKIKDIENDVAVAQLSKMRAEELKGLKNAVSNLSEQEINQLLRENAGVMGNEKATPGEIQFANEKSAILRAESARRKGNVKKAKDQLFEDGKIDIKDAPFVAQLAKSAKDGSEADKALFNTIYKFVQNQLKSAKERKAFVDKMKEETAR